MSGLLTKSYKVQERYDVCIPNGWYAACYSHDIKKDQIQPLSILNQEFVIFRTSKGKIRIFDAYCPHQGTHLGYGGKISEDCIICPFHQWRFNEEGKCVDIPYSKHIPSLKRNCLISYPAMESEGLIFIYYHKQQAQPDFDFPNFSNEYAEDIWTKPKHTMFFLNAHIHEMGENGFDVAHFKPLHNSEENKITLRSDVNDKIMKFSLDLVYPGIGMGLALSKIKVMADWTLYSPGVFSNLITIEKFPITISQKFYFTPQNDGKLVVRFSLRINKTSLPGNSLMKWLQIKLINYKNIKMVLKNFKEDRPIWENKIYRTTPVLCEGDGPILHYRRWAQQFYCDHGPLDR